MSMRAAPFHCPYCGESDLEPIGDERAFYCSSCDRRFELRFLGLGAPEEE
ncbi:MAG: Insertion element protein [Actinobacteria bacterium]|nr:Insertion element protein [Actinomycetota bacterium]